MAVLRETRKASSYLSLSHHAVVPTPRVEIPVFLRTLQREEVEDTTGVGAW